MDVEPQQSGSFLTFHPRNQVQVQSSLTSNDQSGSAQSSHHHQQLQPSSAFLQAVIKKQLALALAATNVQRFRILTHFGCVVFGELRILS